MAHFLNLHSSVTTSKVLTKNVPDSPAASAGSLISYVKQYDRLVELAITLTFVSKSKSTRRLLLKVSPIARLSLCKEQCSSGTPSSLAMAPLTEAPSIVNCSVVHLGSMGSTMILNLKSTIQSKFACLECNY